MRTSSRWVVALALCAAGADAPCLGQTSRPAPGRGPRITYESYQVAAGTFLAIELRSSLSSARSQVGDPVEGRLLRAIVADDTELVPAGATVLGTVRDAEPAGRKTPGRLAFAFHVIEHPETGSRATIQTALVRYESERPPKAKMFPDLQLERGVDASVALLAPLSVKIPTLVEQPQPRRPRKG